jgi:hypothetical protein
MAGIVIYTIRHGTSVWINQPSEINYPLDVAPAHLAQGSWQEGMIMPVPVHTAFQFLIDCLPKYLYSFQSLISQKSLLRLTLASEENSIEDSRNRSNHWPFEGRL